MNFSMVLSFSQKTKKAHIFMVQESFESNLQHSAFECASQASFSLLLQRRADLLEICYLPSIMTEKG